jgi:hypothetical protein
MSNVIQLADASELHAVLRTRSARNAIGKALGRAYPQHPWMVAMSDDGSVAQIVCPAISSEFGMVIHVNQINEELERKAVRMGGELLERFRVSRTAADFSHLSRDARGSAHGAARGEA